MNAKQATIVKDLEYRLSQIRLTCNCTNWMGGCKREFDCSLGWLRDARDKLDELKKELTS